MANGYTAEQVITAIEGSKGFITVIAKRLACTPRHVYNLLDKFSTAKDALFDEREKMRDFVESQIFKQIEAGDTAMTIFYAKTQMKDRGYVERQEHTGAGGGAIATKGEVTLDLTGLSVEQLAALAAWGDAQAASPD